MKLPVPKTLIRTFLPMLLISWSLGIGVLECPMGRPRRIISIFWSIVNCMIYFGFVRMTNWSKIETFHKSRIAANNYHMLDAYLCSIFIVTSICLGHIRAKDVKETHYKLNVMNDKLKTLGIPNDCDLAFRTQIIHISIIMVFILMLIVLDFKYAGFDLPSESSRIGFFMTSHYRLIFGFIVDGNFCTCIRYFSNRFQRLNTLVAGFQSTKKIKTTTTQKSYDQDHRYSSAINRIHRNNSLAIEAAEKLWLLHVIRETRNIHRDLCKLATEFNRTFGIQMLFSVGLSFSVIIALLYTSYMVTTTSSSKLPFSASLIWRIIVLMWISSYAMKVLLVVDACETASSEANRTGILISNFRTLAAGDADIRNEINMFSLQLIQNPLNFTASGFFDLNYSLVRGMIGSVTTYLVIMIQMRTIYEPEQVGSIFNSTMMIQTNDTN